MKTFLYHIALGGGFLYAWKVFADLSMLVFLIVRKFLKR